MTGNVLLNGKKKGIGYGGVVSEVTHLVNTSIISHYIN